MLINIFDSDRTLPAKEYLKARPGVTKKVEAGSVVHGNISRCIQGTEVNCKCRLDATASNSVETDAYRKGSKGVSGLTWTCDWCDWNKIRIRKCADVYVVEGFIHREDPNRVTVNDCWRSRDIWR